MYHIVILYHHNAQYRLLCVPLCLYYAVWLGFFSPLSKQRAPSIRRLGTKLPIPPYSTKHTLLSRLKKRGGEGTPPPPPESLKDVKLWKFQLFSSHFVSLRNQRHQLSPGRAQEQNCECEEWLYSRDRRRRRRQKNISHTRKRALLLLFDLWRINS